MFSGGKVIPGNGKLLPPASQGPIPTHSLPLLTASFCGCGHFRLLLHVRPLPPHLVFELISSSVSSL